MGLTKRTTLNPTDVLSSILTVDGAGSLLDADMTDGMHAVNIIDEAVQQSSIATADKAPLYSPVFKGTPTAPTAAVDTNTTQLATTAFVKTAVLGVGGAHNIIDGRPEGSLYSYGAEEARSIFAIALGRGCMSHGMFSFTAGTNCIAKGFGSIALGHTSAAMAQGSLAAGYNVTASGEGAVSLGLNNAARGYSSFAEGNNTIASGDCSHSQNLRTIAKGECQTVIGKYNIEQGTAQSLTPTDHAFIIGNGNDDAGLVRSNAHTVDWSGNGWYAGKVSAGTAAVPAMPTSANDLTTKQYVDNAVSTAGGGDMSKAIYDTDNDGKVDSAETADTLSVTLPITKGGTGATTAAAAITALGAAPINSPALSGTPTAPTAAVGTNTTQIATTGFVAAAVSAAGGGSTWTEVFNNTGIVSSGGVMMSIPANSLLKQCNNKKLTFTLTLEGNGGITYISTTIKLNSSDGSTILSFNNLPHRGTVVNSLIPIQDNSYMYVPNAIYNNAGSTYFNLYNIVTMNLSTATGIYINTGSAPSSVALIIHALM